MNMPKLRFKADDGADFTEWESMLLGDLVYIQRGGSPRPIAKYLTTGYGINGTVSIGIMIETEPCYNSAV